jgi:hypothetical protein
VGEKGKREEKEREKGRKKMVNLSSGTYTPSKIMDRKI